ncbi:MAG: protein-export chaperone SecB [Sedimentibacter sp.]
MNECKESEFRFNVPKLTGLTYELNDAYEKKSAPIKMKIHTETKILKNDHNAYVSLELIVFDRDSCSRNEVPFYIDITMVGEFEWNDSIDEKFLGILLESNAPATLLSYIRPYISNLTVGSGYPPLIIPLLNFKENKAEYVKGEDKNEIK